MIETVSSALVGLAVNLLSFITKKTVKGIKDLFSEDELNTLLNGAYSDFKESCVTHKTKKDEKILLAVFDEFFIDDRTVLEFRQVFDARGRDVDFNLLEEIFVGVCIKKQIEIETFNFFQAVSHVIAAVETLAQKEDTFREAFQAARLKTIQTYLQKRGTEPNFTFARFKYLAQLREHNNRLRFAGIPDPRDKKDIGLPSVFVMQRAVETVPEDHYRRLVLERGEEADFTGEELQLRRMMRVKTEETREPVKFDTVLNESDKRRFVVLGKPGSGKSTLLKYLMLEAARLHLEHHRETGMRLFPILVEIRKFENALSETNQPDYNILDFLYDSMRKHYNVTLPDNFFETYLESGCALLLFDGLDEVASESRRSEIQRMIGAFTTSFHAGNTVIVTSRIAGYSRARFSTTDYRHFTLEDFNDEEIGTFVRRWYLSRMTNPVEAETKAGELKAALDKKPRIKELAKNPLLLTIIGIIHRYEAQLPEDRLVLYDKAMEALLDTWDNVKDIIDEKFRPEDKRRFLEKTAFHLQSLEQGDEAGTVIEQEELYGILFPDFREIFDCDNRRAKALVDEFLEKIRLRAGLLVELAPGKYGFVHKTFQEYFAAKWIANEATLNYDLQIMTDYVDQFIGNAFWQETLLLALRALPVKQAQKVLDHILKSDPKEMEPYFYHNHYFVMKFIAEQGRWLNNRDFVEKQIYDFFHLSWNEGKDRSYYRNYTRGRFESWVSSANDSLTGSILYELLLVTSEDEKQDGSLRRYCASTVSNLGVKEKAMERLLSLAEDEKQDGYLRSYCASAVGK
ncbi:MAG: NACHT domain-containing protein, partial [bacterium]|nr:NACHT domain-containing protein [bacterium]